MYSLIMFILWVIIQYIFYYYMGEDKYLDPRGRTRNLQHDSEMMNFGSGLCGISFFLNFITVGQFMVYTCIPGIIGVIIFKIYEYDSKTIKWKM